MINLHENLTTQYTHYNHSKIERTDFEIMKCRTLARLRGATPVDIQITVNLLETDNLMRYERQ